jgi:hypothetical protein
MKILFLLTLSFTLLFAGCTKETVTFYYAYLKNKSTHQIQIKPYSFGAVVSANIISLSPSQEIKISDDGFVRGIATNSGFGSNYFSGVDSLVVIFDGLYSITHYFVNPTSLARKYYLNTSTRNIGNKDSYVLIGEDSKQSRTNSYYYDFIEQDYLDAK